MDSHHPRILLCKPRIRALHNHPRIAHANLGSTRNRLGSRNQISAFRGNRPTIDCARKAAWPSVATNPQSLTIVACRVEVHARLHDQSCFVAADGRAACACDRLWLLCRRRSNCFTHTISCGFVSANGRDASLARSIVGLLPRMTEIWLRDPR